MKMRERLEKNSLYSYYYLAETSVSLAHRHDVIAFKNFITPITRGNVLDIGCGPLPLPGYIPIIDGCTYYGIDPLKSESTIMTKTIGIAELLPFPDDSFDLIIWGTSLDHVTSVQDSLSESVRVLSLTGHIAIWHSALCPNVPIAHEDYTRTIQGIDFIVPKGAVDPFHERYIPESEITTTLHQLSMTLTRREIYNTDNLFMEFTYA